MVLFVARHWHSGAGCRAVSCSVPVLVRSNVYACLFQSHLTRSHGKRPACPQAHRLRSRTARGLTVTSAWGDDIKWSPAKVKSSRNAAKGHHTLILELGPAATEKYETPGQYVQVRVNGSKPGFFAIASSPQSAKAGEVELLIRQRGETAELLSDTQEGAQVEASPVGGPGFRIERASPEAAPQLFIFATGSGIAPIKALIESGNLQAEKRKKVKLFWGTHDADSTAFKDVIPSWQAAGVEVVPVYSSDGRGFVQDVFEKENEVQDGASVGVILCGHKEMCQAITAQMEGLGVDKDKILMNF